VRLPQPLDVLQILYREFDTDIFPEPGHIFANNHSGTTYANLTANKTLCETFSQDMQAMGLRFQLRSDKAMSGSTDMGNVSHDNPSFHCAFAIPADADVSIHNPRFAEAAGRPEAHKAAMMTAKGMSMLGIRVLFDDAIAGAALDDFKNNHDW
jgi:metal-dependent amidase/aminoacylase/carboxypeptidase family protein